jgi:hypothetical protein
MRLLGAGMSSSELEQYFTAQAMAFMAGQKAERERIKKLLEEQPQSISFSVAFLLELLEDED